MINTICVCGAGTMGSGIAQVAALSGFKTIQYDISDAMLTKSKMTIESNLQRLVETQKITVVEKRNIIDSILLTSELADCVADLVIEAIIEDIDAKAELFNKLESFNNADAIFATNTSSLSITSVQQNTNRPSMVAGLHFFNPAPVMKLVEIVKGEQTGQGVVDRLKQVCLHMQKQAIVCRDSPGFIVNRVARPYYLEAMKLVVEGTADFITIDEIMEATGFKLGPFKLMDMIGIDINYQVSEKIWEALGKPDRLKPSEMQHQKLKEQKLGRKTGEGFYCYRQ